MSQCILYHLFGPRDVHDLYALSRENLFASIITNGQDLVVPENTTPITDHAELTTSPQNGHAWNESPQSSTYENIADDVNGLSLSVNRSTSYVGISSISTALKVLHAVDPAFQSKALSNFPAQLDLVSTSPSHPFDDDDFGDEQAYVDAYFTSIHGLVPMVDEVAFRRRFLEEKDDSLSWKLLLNMVLIMGSLSTPAPSQAHSNIHARIRPLLNFDCFQYGTIEMVQALCLYGGFYCHFLNKPNVASAVMGSAFKLALAMGLHRVSNGTSSIGDDPSTTVSREAQRRTWWCLLCLDTWASPTLSRPSMGWWNTQVMTTALPAIQNKSVSKPSFISKSFLFHLMLIGRKDYACKSLLASIDFCRIASTIQDRFAQSPVLPADEVQHFHHKISQWYANLSTILTTDTFPHRMQSARTNLLWRAQNMQLILHLPQHYISAVRRRRGEFIDTGTLACVDRCHSLAHDIIMAAINAGMQPDNVYATRAATWYLLQACMSQLVSLFTDPDHDAAPQWTLDIETAIAAVEQVSHLNPTIKRTRDVISAIYQASGSRERTGVDVTGVDVPRFEDMEGAQMLTENVNGNWAWLLDDLDPNFEDFLRYVG